MNEPDSWTFPDADEYDEERDREDDVYPDHPVDCFCVLCLPWPADAESDQYKETL